VADVGIPEACGAIQVPAARCVPDPDILAAVELSDEVLTASPGAVAQVASTAREKGVLVRTLGRGVAVSPPLTVQEEHIGLIAEAIGEGLAGL
jgi:putrescine---pyruvate transaminase